MSIIAPTVGAAPFASVRNQSITNQELPHEGSTNMNERFDRGEERGEGEGEDRDGEEEEKRVEEVEEELAERAWFWRRKWDVHSCAFVP